jgi:hypothetical protein
VNFWILEEIGERTCKLYQKILLSNFIERKETPLHVAGEEGNENIFYFLYSSLAAKTENFESRKLDIENYLLGIYRGSTPFTNYFEHCDDSFNILNVILRDFGSDFVKKFFEKEKQLLHRICKRDSKTILKVLLFLQENFSNDLTFFEKVLLSRDGNDQNFLHLAFSSLKNEIILELFKELHKMKSKLGQDFIRKLVLGNYKTSGVPLSHYADSKYFYNDFLFNFLNQMKLLCGEETLKELFLVDNEYSLTLLQEFCSSAEDFDLLKTIKWVNQEFGKEFLVELVSLNDRCDQTIFHCFTSVHESQSNPGSQILPILEFLKRELNFENEFLLDEILFNVDSEGGSVFTNLFYKDQPHIFYSKLFEFLENDLNFTDQSLENRLMRSNSLFSRISEIEEEKERDEILALFCSKFGARFLLEYHTSEETYDYYSVVIDEIIRHLNFVEDKYGFECLKDSVSRTDVRNRTFLFGIPNDITKILEWLGTNFQNDKEFLEKLLLHVDENGDTFLTFVFDVFDWLNFNEYFTETYNFLIKNFGTIFLQNFILIENQEGENILNVICKEFEWLIIKILNFLLKDFQTDLSFFQKLINEKLRENNRVKRWMKVKLNIDLFGEGEVEEEDIEDLDASFS